MVVLYAVKTREKEQPRGLLPQYQEIDVTYYLGKDIDNEEPIVIRQTRTCFSLIISKDKTKEVRKKLEDLIKNEIDQKSEATLGTLELTDEQYHDLLRLCRTIKYAEADKKVIGKIYKGVDRRLQDARNKTFLYLSEVFNPQEPVSEQELAAAGKDDSNFVAPSD